MKQHQISAIKKTKFAAVWPVAAALLLLVILTGAIVINLFFFSSQNSKSDAQICITENSPLAAPVTAPESTNISNSSGNTQSGTPSDQVDITQQPNVWTNTAQIDIFKHNDSHVESDGTGTANNVIAPGTSNDYTFSLQNSKDFGVKYTLEITGGNDSDYKIPIQLTVENGSGNSLTNGKWVELENFSKLTDVGKITSNSQNQYIIRWKWNFENGSDDYDTFLGDTAVSEEIPCHISINVIAEYDPTVEPPTSSNYTPLGNLISALVTTGDTVNILAITGVLVICGILIIILIRKKHSKQNQQDN